MAAQNEVPKVSSGQNEYPTDWAGAGSSAGNHLNGQQQDHNLPLDGQQDGYAQDMLGIYFG